jgi:aminomethyltransferase folate-binding domain-containing protein
MGRRAGHTPHLASSPMAVTHGQVASPALVDCLRDAGGVMVMRDGHQVAAHFGSTATEVAVCVKRVGLAVRSDLAAMDTAPDGHQVPSPGRARRIAGTWYCRVASDRAVVIGPRSELRGQPKPRRDRTVLTLVGPKAHQVLADAGLRNGLELGGLRESWFADSPAILLRESAASYLLVVDTTEAGEAWRTLLDAGRSLGLSMVGAEAIARLAAAPAAAIF